VACKIQAEKQTSFHRFVPSKHIIFKLFKRSALRRYHPIFLFVCSVLLWTGIPASGQTDGLLEIDGSLERFLIRQQTAGHLDDAILSHRPISVRTALALLAELELSDPVDCQLRDQFLGLAHHPGAEWLRGQWTAAFRNGRDLFSAEDTTWAIQVNSILNLSAGRAFFGNDPLERSTKNVWRSSRGARLSGHIGPYVYFEGQVSENQEQVVDPAVEYGTAPGRPSTKLSEGGAYDWMETRAVVGFQTSHFDLRFGRDDNLWGYGAKSTILSNIGSTYDQVQIRAALGRFQYVSLLYAPASFGPRTSDGFAARKYAASHRLAAKLGSKWEIGLVETLVFGTDSLDTRTRFDLAYANPIIFLRSAERDRGSPDNAMIGLSASFQPRNGVKVYGELLLDEYVPDNFGKGWWANKWAWQLGAHGVDLGLPRSSLRIEIARMRPFLYSHKRTVNSYTHFGDVLGHPAGPNAWNLFIEAGWIANERLTLTTVVDLTHQGVNTDLNYGSDPNRSYSSRVSEFDNDFLQGNLTNTSLVSWMASFELLPQMYIDASAAFVSTERETGGNQMYFLPRVSVRLNSNSSHLPR